MCATISILAYQNDKMSWYCKINIRSDVLALTTATNFFVISNFKHFFCFQTVGFVMFCWLQETDLDLYCPRFKLPTASLKVRSFRLIVSVTVSFWVLMLKAERACLTDRKHTQIRENSFQSFTSLTKLRSRWN